LSKRSLINGEKGLKLGSFTQKVAVHYTVDSALLSIVSHNLEKKVSVIGKMHKNEPWNTKIWTVINLATVKVLALAVATNLFSTFLQYAVFSFNYTE
jgi:hypothetical protein